MPGLAVLDYGTPLVRHLLVRARVSHQDQIERKRISRALVTESMKYGN